jgi:hypothetical protein
MRRYQYVCIPQNAAHPNAAILFGLYASSPEGQKKIELGLVGADLDDYPETQTHAQIAVLEQRGVKFIDVTVAWWGGQKNIAGDLEKLTTSIRRN